MRGSQEWGARQLSRGRKILSNCDSGTAIIPRAEDRRGAWSRLQKQLGLWQRRHSKALREEGYPPLPSPGFQKATCTSSGRVPVVQGLGSASPRTPRVTLQSNVRAHHLG